MIIILGLISTFKVCTREKLTVLLNALKMIVIVFALITRALGFRRVWVKSQVNFFCLLGVCLWPSYVTTSVNCINLIWTLGITMTRAMWTWYEDSVRSCVWGAWYIITSITYIICRQKLALTTQRNVIIVTRDFCLQIKMSIRDRIYPLSWNNQKARNSFETLFFKTLHLR